MSSADMEAASAVPFCQKMKHQETQTGFGLRILIDGLSGLSTCGKNAQNACFHELVWAKILPHDSSYLDFIHAVSGAQPADTLQGPSDVERCGVPG